MEPNPKQSWSGRSVLVTGACGFIGKWLVEKLVREGAAVTAFDRVNNALPSRISSGRVRLVIGDVTDVDSLIGLINKDQIDTVFHLAATNINTGAGISPFDVYEANLRGTYSLLEACRRAAMPPAFILSSSREVDDCWTPDSSRRFHPYMTSKASAELCSRAFDDTYGMACAIVRLDNVYGGGDTNWRRLIPGTIKSVLANETPVIRSDGLLERDYVYIDDAVDSFLAVGVDIRKSRSHGRIFRVGSGTGTNARRIVELVLQAANRSDLGVHILGESGSERVDAIAGPGKELAALGWRPHVSVEAGIDLAVKWYHLHASEIFSAK